MYCILNDNIALRSYQLVPYAYLNKGGRTANGLSEDEFELLIKCDGNTRLEKSPVLAGLLERGLAEPCQRGERTLSDWQKYIFCDNRYMPMLNLQITGKCNYNCRHCFNCKDNAPLQSEMSFENIIKLLDECAACGVTSFTITGGEPFLHPHFREILEAIYKRNLFVFELNTNGYFINEEILDYMLSIGCRPEIKISFDGLGFHDWMRQHNGAEKTALDAIRLCLSKAFPVRVQMNVNKKNQDSIYPSLCLLDEMGVSQVRLIKTTDAPRWKENSKDLDFAWGEYYDFLADLFKVFAHEEHNIIIDVWQTLYYNSKNHYYNIVASSGKDKTDSNAFICPSGRKMAAIASTGELYPCMQMQGYMAERGISFGNVFKDGLKSLLNEGKFMNLICLTIKDRLNSNDECKACEYNRFCTGGCPALAVLTGSRSMDCYLKPDRTKCIMLKEAYYQKLTDAFGIENKNSCPMW